MESVELIDIDTMLEHVGDFERYQYMLMTLFSVINIFSAFHYFGQTFISLIPDHKCKLLPDENRKYVSPSQCLKTFINETGSYGESCTSWDYNNTYNYISLVQQLDWVCSDNWKAAMGQSVFFIGSVVGSLGFGILADRIGRLHVLVMANILALFGNLATIISSDVVLFSASRFVAGSATDTNFVMMYIIVMEYIKPSMRTFGLNICIGIFYCLACMAVPWAAVLLRTWRWFLLLIALPHIFVLAFYFLVPESAQWLLSKKRTEQAIICFQRIAKINGRNINRRFIEGLRKYADQHITTSHHGNLLGLLRTPKLRRKTLILIFKSMVMTLCYDAISRNVNGLGFSPFVIFTVSSFTILPACIFILMVQDRVGRKALASGALMTCGIFTAVSAIVLALIEDPDPSLTAILAVVARLAINVAYNSGAQYAVELIPTEVRGQGVSAIHVAGYAASFFSPQILYLSNFWRPFPEVTLGILLILGAVACLFLPETLNRTLPVTLEDGENFGEDEGILEFACCQKRFSESTQMLTPATYTQKYVG